MLRYYSPNKIYIFLLRPDIRRISISRENIRLEYKRDKFDLSASELRKVSLNKNLIFYEIVLDHVSGSKFAVKGLSRDTAVEAFGKLQRLYLDCLIEKIWPDFLSVYDSWISLLRSPYYFNNARYVAWRRDNHKVGDSIQENKSLFELADPEKREILLELGNIFQNGPELIRARNEQFVAVELKQWKNFLDSVESKPLTQNQRLAVVHDEDNNLVIAGAGTGKTSTIVAKVGYVIKRDLAKPEEILLLAFTRKAAEEMRERIEEKFGAALNVRTFHSLGLEILAHSEGRKPSLCKEADDEALMRQLLEEIIQSLLKLDEFRHHYLTFRVFYSTPYKPAWHFETMADYKDHLRQNNIRALSGNLVKSLEECAIANWLYMKGINFEYEPKYKHDVADREHRQYRPDFYLVDYDIYIEHFAVNKKGKTPKWIPEEHYKAQMEWKRQLHKEKGTVLKETYSWQHAEGTLLKNLDEFCRSRGIVSKPIPAEDILKRLNDMGIVDPLAQLMAAFQSLFKGNGQTRDELYEKLKQGDVRSKLFLDMFFAVHEMYEERNRKSGDIDFNDMIVKACDHVDSGRYQLNFKYILVDEFQDISGGRARLLKALRNHEPEGTRLFCVGDDWQSIYRFTGSDISLMTDFERNFGFTKSTSLDKTFRFNDQIESVSTRFILKNPSQLKKRLQPNSHVDFPAVSLILKGARQDHIGEIIREIRSENGKASVFILNRYNFLTPDREFQRSIARQFKGIKLSCLTAHSAKGLEADYVIIDNVNAGRYGFPSEIVDDPLLDLVLPKPDKHENGEERRLFYVALTRARKRVFVVADQTSYSAFFKELVKDNEYEVERSQSGTPAANPAPCPACGSGSLLPRTSSSGNSFYSCSNYPLCGYAEDVCPVCRKGPFVKNGASYWCLECGTGAPLMP